MIGGVLSTISLSAPVYAAGIFAVLATIVGYFILPETLPREKRESTTIKLKELNPLASIGKFITRPVLWILLVVLIIVNFTFQGFTVTFPVFIINEFHINPISVGSLFLVSGIVISLVQGGLIGRLEKKFGDKKLLMSGILILAVGLVLISTVKIFWIFYPILAFISLGMGLILPTLNSIISKIVLPYEIGEIFGVTASLMSLMTVLGPLVAGFLYDNITASAPYLTDAILLILAFILMIRFKQPQATKIDQNISDEGNY